MRVALLSDIHDNITHLLLALHTAEQHGCTHLLFMGDMTAASTFRTLREEWPHPIDLVFGNNEYELNAFSRIAEASANTRLHGTAANIELDKRRLFFTHLPRDAYKTAEAGNHDAVFYGHTHTQEIRTIGSTLVVNPGEIYGRNGVPSIGIYDTLTNSASIIRI